MFRFLMCCSFVAVVNVVCANDESCYPIAVPESALAEAQPGDVISNLRMGAQPGNFGWLTWNGNRNVPTLVASLTPPGNSSNYINPDDIDDHLISIGDWIRGKPGVSNSRKLRNALDVLTTVDIVVPLWNDTRGRGAHAAYRVSGFARIRILSYRLPGHNRITFRFLGLLAGGEENQPPTAFSLTYTITEDSPLDITFTGNDPESDPLTFSVVVPPDHGTLTGTPPQVTYQPLADYNGSDLFAFKANDGNLDSSNAIVNISITPVNDAPIAQDSAVTTDENQAVAVVLSSTDVDGDQLTYQIAENPAHGTLTGTEPILTYTPDSGYYGVDSFRYVAVDPQGATSDSAIVSITVNLVNEPPVAMPQSITLAENTYVAIVLAGTDPDDDQITFHVVETPAYGIVTNDASQLLYIPVTDHTGYDSFKFVAVDAFSATSTPATVSITITPVNVAPLVNAGSNVSLSSVQPVALAGAVVDDGLPEGSELTTLWKVVAGAADAVAFDDSSRTNATANFAEPGNYTLQLTALDGAAAASDEMIVSICLPNVAPVAEAGEDFEVEVGSLVALNGVATDDNKPKDGILVAQWSVLTGDVSVVQFEDSSNTATSIRFTTNGVFVLSLVASDGELTSQDTVTVTVLPVSNQPPVVDAGPHQDVALFTTCRLFGSAEDDGLPEDDDLTYLWSQVGGPEQAVINDASQTNSSVKFSASGDYRFRLTVSDGELSVMAETTVSVELVNQPPVVDAGDDIGVNQGSQALLQGMVTDDGLPNNHTSVVQWTALSGPGSVVFDNPDIATTSIEVSSQGEYVLRLFASDGELEDEDLVTVLFGSQTNLAPVVDAGADRTVDFSLVRTTNLVVNPGAEIALTNGVVTGWTYEGVQWQTPTANSLGFDAVEGSRVLCPDEGNSAEIYQDVDISLFADPIDDGQQLFEFSVSYRVTEQIRYDEPRVRIEYLDDMGAVLESSDISPTPISSNWGLLADTGIAPQCARSIRIRLFATNSGIDSSNDVFFDGVSLCGVQLAPVEFEGQVSDDGLPEDGQLSTEWTMISGPVAAIIENDKSLSGNVFFSAPGIYEMALSADDGELMSEDHVLVSVVDDGGKLPLSVDAGTNQVVCLPLALADLSGTVTNCTTNALTVSWTEVSGNSRVFMENADTLHPQVRFYELGEYTLRLSASDGTQVAYDEIRVEVSAPQILRSMDVVMVLDKSGSMGGNRIVNARLAAQQFVERLMVDDRAAVVSFTTVGSVLQGLTYDHAAAVSAITPIGSGGGTAIDQGVLAAREHLLNNGRTNAEWVVVLLSDGGSTYATAVAESQAAQAMGVRIMSVGMSDSVNEELMSDVASSRADYFYAESEVDLEPLYESLSRSFCRFGEEGLEVYAGSSLQLPCVDTPVSLSGRVSYDLEYMSCYSVSSEWNFVSGPASVQIEDPSSTVTTARFSVPGIYELSLTGWVYAWDTLQYEKIRPLTVVIDQPSDIYAPDDLVALWKAEGNALDSISNFHGDEPYGLTYSNSPVQCSFAFNGSSMGISVPTLGQLDVGSSINGFSVGFWAKVDDTSGFERLFGWFDDEGVE
ncbi:MAG: Ig-like domain-containing protein [Kiritimatiellia bacterium]